VAICLVRLSICAATHWKTPFITRRYPHCLGLIPTLKSSEPSNARTKGNALSKLHKAAHRVTSPEIIQPNNGMLLWECLGWMDEWVKVGSKCPPCSWGSSSASQRLMARKKMGKRGRLRATAQFMRQHLGENSRKHLAFCTLYSFSPQTRCLPHAI